jgi:hypothetical protein
MGTLTSCNPLDHCRPVTGLLYLYLLYLFDCLILYSKLKCSVAVLDFQQGHGHVFSVRTGHFLDPDRNLCTIPVIVFW